MVHHPKTDRSWVHDEADREILMRLSTGETVGAIARRLQVSDRTVRRRLKSMSEVLGVETTIEVVVRAVRDRVI